MIPFGTIELTVHGVVMDVMDSRDQKLRPGEKPADPPWRSVAVAHGRNEILKVAAGVADWDCWRKGDFVIAVGDVNFQKAREENNREKAAEFKMRNCRSLKVRQTSGEYVEQLGGHGGATGSDAASKSAVAGGRKAF